MAVESPAQAQADFKPTRCDLIDQRLTAVATRFSVLETGAQRSQVSPAAPQHVHTPRCFALLPTPTALPCAVQDRALSAMMRRNQDMSKEIARRMKR